MSVAMTEATDGTVSIWTVRRNMMALQEAWMRGDGSGVVNNFTAEDVT